MIQFDRYFYFIAFSYFIGNLIVAFSTISIGAPQSTSKYKNWCFYSIGLSFILILLYPIQDKIALHIILATIISSVILRILLPLSLKKCIWMSIYNTVISCIAEFVCVCFLWNNLHLKAYSDFAGNNLYILTGITFSNLILLTLTALIPAASWIIYPHMRCHESFLYCIFPIYQFVLFCLCFNMFEHPSMLMIITGNVILILGVLIDAILLFSLDNLINKRTEQSKLEKLLCRQKSEYEYYLHIQDQLNQHRIIKHEFANHLTTIYALYVNQASPEVIDNMIQSSSTYLEHCQDHDDGFTTNKPDFNIKLHIK